MSFTRTTRFAACLLVFTAAIQVSSSASGAPVRTCLQIESDSADELPGLEKLVRVEMARHRSHTVVEEGCESKVSVDLFEAGGERQLTVRANDEVPMRYVVSGSHPLSERVSQALSLVLGNDPVMLAQDPSKLSATQRAVRGVLVNGYNSFNIELVQGFARTGQGASTAFGGAVGVSRGSGHWRVMGRLYGMGNPEPRPGGRPTLQLGAGADLGVIFEVSEKANTTFYMAAGLGLQYLRFEGEVEGTSFVDNVGALLPVGMARVGLRLFRCYDFGFDVFAAGHLPMMATKETDSELFGDDGRFTPSFQLGVGLSF